MGNFKLGRHSLTQLHGVKSDLAEVVQLAIQITPVDFTVLDGVRTIEEQREYVRRGVSTTMQSRHLTGDAVDLVPYINGKLRWEWPPIFQITAAMHEASLQLGVPLVWGGVWDRTLSDLPGDVEGLAEASELYVRRQRARGYDRIFLDGPHFQRANA